MNRLTGEDRDVITSKVTLAKPAEAMPGSGGLLVNTGSTAYPFNSETADTIRRLLAEGNTVIRAWDVLWPADGGAPRIITDTGYLQ